MATKQKKQSRVRRILGAGITWRDIARQSLGPAREGGGFLAGAWRELRRRARRDPGRESQRMALMREDFQVCRNVWGFTAEEEGVILKHMRVHRWVLAGVIVFSVIAGIAGMRARMFNPWLTFEAMAMVLVLAGFGILKVTYRIDVLTHQRFIPFREWIAGLFGRAKES